MKPYLLDDLSSVPTLDVFKLSFKIFSTESLILRDVGNLLDTLTVSFVIASLETKCNVKLSLFVSEITSVILET